MSSANSKDGDTTRLCNYCKREVALANFVLHEVHCMRHIALCPQCNEPFPKAQLKEHIAQDHSKVPCELCEKEFERHELEDHKVNNCSQRPVTCEYCEIELPVSKMQDHEDVCGSRTEKCVTCQLYIMIKHSKEHKLSNCKPPEEEQDWEPEDEEEEEEVSPNYGYVDEYDDHDDMLPCEFCGRPYPFDFLIQHQSGCDQNATQRNPFSSAHQPREFHVPEDDVPADELKDLNINPSKKDLENVVENNLRPEKQENRLPINQKRTGDHAPSVQSEKSTVEKMKTDKSHKDLDSESARNKTSTVKENYTSHKDLDSDSARNETSTVKENCTSSVDVIPCEFCDSPIELTRLMEHQKMCRWVHPNRAFNRHRFADDGENEDDFDGSHTRYDHRFQRGRGSAASRRGLTNGNTKWTSERNGHAANMSKRPYTENRSHWEEENDPDSVSETSSNQTRPPGRSGYRNYNQDRRQTYAEDQPHGYRGRTDYNYQGSRWQHEEKDKVRPLMDVGFDDLKREGQREGTMRQQHEDNHWSNGQQEQQDRPNVKRQERNDNPRSRAPREEPDLHESRAPPKVPDADRSRAPQEQPDLRESRAPPKVPDADRSRAPQEQPDLHESRAPPKVPGTDRSRAPQEQPDIPRSKGQKQEQANTRPEAQNNTEEKLKNDRGYQSQPKRQQVGVRQRWTQGAEGDNEMVSPSARVQPEEENWRRKDGQSQARSPRGRGRPAQNHSNTGSQRDEENETPKEPAANPRTERKRGGQTQQNLRHEEGQEARPREGDDQGQTRSGRGGRGRGRGRYNWRQDRWNRTKDQAEEDYYNAPWPRKSYRDHNE